MTPIKTEHPYIVKVPGVRGGKPIIAGTRIPIWLLIANWKQGCSPEEILEHYPQLTLAQLYDALSYYYDHPDEIEAQIREHDLSEDELTRLQAQWPPRSST
ncbi:MAG: DUF433 domain-containing protein [Candidatus Bipolaricaulota bacterium]|nr:DUF433 domain-containing protein [Candidatus Bipolaricaulota bacterium]